MLIILEISSLFWEFSVQSWFAVSKRPNHNILYSVNVFLVPLGKLKKIQKSFPDLPAYPNPIKMLKILEILSLFKSCNRYQVPIYHI